MKLTKRFNIIVVLAVISVGSKPSLRLGKQARAGEAVLRIRKEILFTMIRMPIIISIHGSLYKVLSQSNKIKHFFNDLHFMITFLSNSRDGTEWIEERRKKRWGKRKREKGVGGGKEF